MRKKLISAFIMVCYCVPWVFLGMYGDYTLGKMWPYVLMIAVPAVLTGLCARRRLCLIPVMGNLLSTGVSWCCVRAVGTEKWDYFFKAFPCTIRLLQFAGISLVIQGIVWWIAGFYSKDQT